MYMREQFLIFDNEHDAKKAQLSYVHLVDIASIWHMKFTIIIG